ncbi:sensor histidine kinase [Chryseobacterium sp. MP_3.2]|uniref:sensor histidine kinase n=1 Tax=Chryseobacterium sp. MP_3.2 TaxID=3071712 RepID=UPI002DFB7A03|nr:signal transduction histidine kinase [Chryseobacterium sp. MP_3.2]
MNSLPADIKVSIVLSIVLMVSVVVFLIFVVLLYSRKQILYQKEIALQEMIHGNQLLQKEVDFQKKAQKEHERISHDMHDDLGAGISAIKLQAEFLKQNATDTESVENIQDLLQTCEELNSSMREMLWSLNSRSDTLVNFVEDIVTYTKNFFGKTEIRVNFKKFNINFSHVSASQRRNLFLCTKEALNNIYKHSNANNIEIVFRLVENHLTISIIDDGIGIVADSPKGNGLENLRCRMADLEGDFNFIAVDRGVHIDLSLKLEEAI